MSADVAPDGAANLCGRPAIALDGVRFAWRRGEPPLLDIARFEVARAERVFVAGPSGSGKSTLLGLLGGVLVPGEGEVTVLGTDIARLGGARRDRFRADHVGFVFQLFNLVPYLSVLDNVVLPCRFSRRRRERALARGTSLETEAGRLLAGLELGIETLGGRPVTELSIGQQQRVAAARAMMGAPEIVIADEPTSALDEGTRERFVELLFAECSQADTTLVFVSHDERLGGHFDRRVALRDLSNRPCPPSAKGRPRESGS